MIKINSKSCIFCHFIQPAYLTRSTLVISAVKKKMALMSSKLD